VVVSDIDGPVVKLELQGACGSCPSSTMTMKMGLERRLKEKIPEISEVRCVVLRCVLLRGPTTRLAHQPVDSINPVYFFIVPLFFMVQVIQAMPEGPALTEANIDGVCFCFIYYYFFPK
jgi:hypothetical protein